MKILKAERMLLPEPSIADDGGDHSIWRPPKPRLEVFSVHFQSHDGYDPGDLFGAITVVDSFGVEDIYNAKGGDYYDVSSREGLKELVMTGPNRNLHVRDAACILVRLTKNEMDLFPDNDIIRDSHWGLPYRWKGGFDWNPFGGVKKFDEPLKYINEAEFGKVILNYAVFKFGMGALLEVMLINNGGGSYGENNPADVYGRITARNSNFMDHESVIFWKKKSVVPGIHVKSGQLIPLLRSAVAVPKKSSLIVSGDLWDCNRCSPHDEIANFSLEFPVQSHDGISEKNFFGHYGEIKVKVTWERL